MVQRRGLGDGIVQELQDIATARNPPQEQGHRRVRKMTDSQMAIRAVIGDDGSDSRPGGTTANGSRIATAAR